MDAAHLLRHARRRAGLTQRGLAAAAGVPQSTVGRIEAGRIAPSALLLDRLLRAAGSELTAEPVLGAGVDRSQMRELLRLSPAQRARLAAGDARALIALRARRVT